MQLVSTLVTSASSPFAARRCPKPVCWRKPNSIRAGRVRSLCHLVGLPCVESGTFVPPFPTCVLRPMPHPGHNEQDSGSTRRFLTQSQLRVCATTNSRLSRHDLGSLPVLLRLVGSRCVATIGARLPSPNPYILSPGNSAAKACRQRSWAKNEKKVSLCAVGLLEPVGYCITIARSSDISKRNLTALYSRLCYPYPEHEVSEPVWTQQWFQLASEELCAWVLAINILTSSLTDSRPNAPRCLDCGGERSIKATQKSPVLC
jgi:hypothetical protein